jgi:hypothetical protein
VGYTISKEKIVLMKIISVLKSETIDKRLKYLPVLRAVVEWLKC